MQKGRKREEAGTPSPPASPKALQGRKASGQILAESKGTRPICSENREILRKSAKTLTVYIYNYIIDCMVSGADTVSRYIHEHEAAVNAVRVVVDAQNT